MRRKFRNVLLVAFALTGVAVWAGTKVGQAVQLSKPEPADKLVRATVCVASAYHVMAGTDATMSVQNDGGWCWVDTYERANWRTLSAISVAVTRPPRHGRVQVRDIDNQEIRIAYQPESGFGGQDSFSIRYDSEDSEKIFVVAVSKPAGTAPSDGRSIIATRTADSWAYLGTSGGYLTNMSRHAERQTAK
jgi:hypothetical protein